MPPLLVLTLTSSDDTIEAFYELLKQTLRGIHRSDKIFLLGDFNARVGSTSNHAFRDQQAWHRQIKQQWDSPP